MTLDNLSQNERRHLENFPQNAREKVIEQLDSGYRIVDYDYWEVEICKGFSYKKIDRTGRMYSI